MGDWTVFSNHGHVLVCLARNNDARLRDVAADVGITERAVQNILRDLQDAGFVAVTKHGRCNRYRINTRRSLRHPLESSCNVGKLLGLVLAERSGEAKASIPADPVNTPADKPTGTPPDKKAEKRREESPPGPRMPSPPDPIVDKPSPPKPELPTTVSPGPLSPSGSSSKVEHTADVAPGTELAAELPRTRKRKQPETEEDDGQQGSLF